VSVELPPTMANMTHPSGLRTRLISRRTVRGFEECCGGVGVFVPQPENGALGCGFGVDGLDGEVVAAGVAKVYHVEFAVYVG